MTRRNRAPPEYSGWNIAEEGYQDAEYVGVIGTEKPIFYDARNRSIFEGKPHEDEKRISPVEGSEESLAPEETVGDYVERIGEKTGWDALSDFAREHLDAEGGTDERSGTDET